MMMSERSAEISAAARELIIETGGALPTIRQIAARSYLSPAAIYVHFPNFDAIVENVREGAVIELFAALRESATASAEKPATLDEILAVAASWMVENHALVVACTTSSVEPPATTVELVNKGLEESGYPATSLHLVRLGFQLLVPVPMLVNELGYGPDEVAKYLHALLGPLETVSALPPIEVIHA